MYTCELCGKRWLSGDGYIVVDLKCKKVWTVCEDCRPGGKHNFLSRKVKVVNPDKG